MWLTLWVKTPKSCSELVQTQQLLSGTISSRLRAPACQLTWEKVWKQSPEQQYFSNFCCWGWWVYKVPIISCETFTHWTHSLITERLWNTEKTKLRPFLCFHINYIKHIYFQMLIEIKTMSSVTPPSNLAFLWKCLY